MAMISCTICCCSSSRFPASAAPLSGSPGWVGPIAASQLALVIPRAWASCCSETISVTVPVVTTAAKTTTTSMLIRIPRRMADQLALL
jgi:hypothetical protein